MAKDDTTTKIIHIVLAAMFVAVLGWIAVGVLFTATEYTETTEAFTGVNLTAVDLGNTRPLIPSSESVYNATSGVIIADSGTNYTMDNTAGTITINCTSGYMADGSVYTIDYHQGAVDTTVSTICKLLIGMIFFIAIIVILLNYVGIKIEK